MDRYVKFVFVLILALCPQTLAQVNCTDKVPSNQCIVGGGPPSTDCYLEWYVKSTRGPISPKLNSQGFPQNLYICYEGDRRCDVDSDIYNNSCSVESRLCINNIDPRLSSCLFTDVESLEVKSPRPNSLVATDQYNLASLEESASNNFGVSIIRSKTPTIIGNSNQIENFCSDKILLKVPMKVSVTGKVKVGRATFKIAAKSSASIIDNDSMRIQCFPSTCGNGIVEVDHETCDDSNRVNGDGCDQGCQLEPPPSTPTPTLAATNIPTATRTSTSTGTPIPTDTATTTPTITKTFTGTQTSTPTYTFTPTNTSTKTPTPTWTSTYTKTRTSTSTRTPTKTPTITKTPTETRTITPTPTGTRPPKIVVDSPIMGEFTNSSSISIMGHIEDPVADQVITVNDQPANITNDTFSYTIPLDAAAIFNPALVKLNVQATGFETRARHIIIRGTKTSTTEFDNNAITLRINNNGFNQLAPVLKSQLPLDSATLQTLLGLPVTYPVNQCVADTFLGCATYIRYLYLGSVSTTGFDFGLVSMTGYAQVNVQIYNLWVRGYFNGTWTFGDLNCPLNVFSNPLDVQTQQYLSPAADPQYLDVDQPADPNVILNNFSWNMNSNSFAGSNTSCDVVKFLADTFASGTIKNLVHDNLVNFLKDKDSPQDETNDAPIAGALQGALQSLSIAGPIGSALGAQLDAPFNIVALDTVGITLRSNVRATSLNHPVNAPVFTGSLHINESSPSYSGNTPVNNLPYHLAIGLGSSAFNQLFKVLTEGGLLNLELNSLTSGGPQLTAGDLSGIISEFGPPIDPITPLRIVVEPSVAPVLTGNPGPNPNELVEMKLANLIIKIVNANTGSVYLSVGADVITGLALTYNQVTNSISIAIGEITANNVNATVIDNYIGTNETNLQALIPTLLTQALPSLSGGLGELPLPSILGLIPNGLEVSRQGQATSVFLNLSAP